MNVSAPQTAAGQTISAKVSYHAMLYKQYHNYQRDRFPQKQSIPPEISKQYLGESPGIQTRSKEVRDLLKIKSGEWKLVGNHPLDRYMRR